MDTIQKASKRIVYSWFVLVFLILSREAIIGSYKSTIELLMYSFGFFISVYIIVISYLFIKEIKKIYKEVASPKYLEIFFKQKKYEYEELLSTEMIVRKLYLQSRIKRLNSEREAIFPSRIQGEEEIKYEILLKEIVALRYCHFDKEEIFLRQKQVAYQAYQDTKEGYSFGGI